MWFIIKSYRKVVETMAVIYATPIVKGVKTINDVPARIKDKVKHNEKTWICDIDNNVWEPGTYGWTEET